MCARTLREATVVALAASVLALAVNAVRPGGLPLVAGAPYEVLVPCPEPGGPVMALEPGEAARGSARTFLIDARDGAVFATGHLPGAVNVPYDWLDPVPEAVLRELARSIAASRATRVIVYGDGGRPDSGEHLGREISGRGIRNVAFVRGGAAALLGEGGR
jgi:rhodanese-related sulfurtransferase